MVSTGDFFFLQQHYLDYRCSRCGYEFTHWALHDSRLGLRSDYIRLSDWGSCKKNPKPGHVDCPQDCSHPGPLIFLARVVLKVVQGTPVFGYGKLIEDRTSEKTWCQNHDEVERHIYEAWARAFVPGRDREG